MIMRTLSLRRDLKIQQFQKKNFQFISTIISKELSKGLTLFSVIIYRACKIKVPRVPKCPSTLSAQVPKYLSALSA